MAKSGSDKGRVGYGMFGVAGTVKHLDKLESPPPPLRSGGTGDMVYEYGRVLTSPLVYL